MYRKTNLGNDPSALTRSPLEVNKFIKLYRTRGLNPRVRPMGRAAASPPCGVMDRDSTGETPSALCPPQEAGFTLNQWNSLLRACGKKPREEI